MGAILRLLAISASLIIAASFLFFAVDEMDRGSKAQQQAVAEGTGMAVADLAEVAPNAADEAIREEENTSVREAVDDANDVLLAPFGDIVSSNDSWVIRGVPTLLGLLIYGFGLGLLANFLPKQQSHAHDWRTA